MPTAEANEPPAWAAAVVDRLHFLARNSASPTAVDALAVTTSRLLHQLDEQGAGARALHAFLRSCLALLAKEVASRPDLATVSADIVELCDLAAIALDSDLDDRPVLQRSYPLMDLSGAPGWAGRVPGRFVWLAAMAAGVPDEEAGAAVMLVNDLAAVSPDLPLSALKAATELGSYTDVGML